MARKEDFNRKVPLPSGLTATAIQKAIDYIEKALADLVGGKAVPANGD